MHGWFMAASVLGLLRGLPPSYTRSLLPPSEISNALATDIGTVDAARGDGVSVQFRNPKPCRQQLVITFGG